MFCHLEDFRDQIKVQIGYLLVKLNLTDLMFIKSNTKFLLALIFFMGLSSVFSQEFNNFEVRYQNNLKGDLTFIANNILNRDGGTGTTDPEDAYNNLSTNNNNNPDFFISLSIT